MMKRISGAIVVLVVSFAILWVALALLAYYVGALGASLADIFQVDAARFVHDPQTAWRTAQAAWEAEIKQYGQNPQVFSQLIAAHVGKFGSDDEPALFVWFTLAAAIGAIIFSTSRLSERIENALLTPRKWTTAALVWSYSVALFFSLMVIVAFSLGGFYVGFSAWFTPPATNPFSTTAQAQADVQKQITEAVLAFDTQHGVTIILGSLAFAIVIAIYIANRVVHSASVPWCRIAVLRTTVSGHGIRAR